MKPTQDDKYEIDVNDLNFHPILKDIKHIFIHFLLSFKALSLVETQQIMLSDVNFSQILKKYNKMISFKIEKAPNSATYTTRLNMLEQMTFLGKAIAILMYDYILASKYNDKLNNDNDIKFLKYIRNGATHNNRFNMRDEEGKWKIEESKFIKWHNKKIDRKLHGKQVFPKFVSILDMVLLANEISKKLNRLDG
ncbi:MAG: hypothetical protein M1308_21790 [Actinobacteria bacterium]|nr:hypothetical protein [Actinomycetota bacterium]